MRARIEQRPYTPEQRDLAARYYELAFWVVGRWFSSLDDDEQREAVECAAVDGLLYAATRYDPQRLSTATRKPVQFNTFAVTAIRRRCLRALKQLNTRRRRETLWSLNRTNHHLTDGRPKRSLDPALTLDLDSDHRKGSIAAALDLLSDRDRDMLISSVDGVSCKVIGERWGITGERVRQRNEKTKTRLRKLLAAVKSDLE